MQRLRGSSRTVAVALALVGAACTVLADDPALEALRAKFKARYPKLVELQRAGKLGETSKGFVEAVRPEYLREPVVKTTRDEENADRKKLYAILAKQEGAEPGQVAERNARRNFEKARPGMEGLAQLINRDFCARGLSGYTFVNREQDLGDEGLRQAKMSYHPDHLAGKYRVIPWAEGERR